MKVSTTPLAGVLVIAPRVFGDARGFFVENFELGRYQSAGMKLPFVQDNHSRSQCGVLRGLHYQLRYPQGKLVRAASSSMWRSIFAAAHRSSAATFDRARRRELSAALHTAGLRARLRVWSGDRGLQYKCTEVAHRGRRRRVVERPEVGDPYGRGANLSTKDQNYPPLHALPPERLPRYEGTRENPSPCRRANRYRSSRVVRGLGMT